MYSIVSILLRSATNKLERCLLATDRIAGNRNFVIVLYRDGKSELRLECMVSAYDSIGIVFYVYLFGAQGFLGFESIALLPKQLCR